MTEPVALGGHYRRCRQRLTALLADAPPAVWSTPVPACPGWDVKAVVSHLVGVIEDGMAGRISGRPDEDQTAAEVARHRDDPPDELLARWDELATGVFEPLIDRAAIWPAVLDVVSHEHDVRGAIGAPGGRDADTLRLAATTLIESAEPPGVWRVDLGDATVTSPPAEGEVRTLRASPFDVVRFRLGRRSRSQVVAMAWDAPPSEAFVDSLFVFGPRAADLPE